MGGSPGSITLTRVSTRGPARVARAVAFAQLDRRPRRGPGALTGPVSPAR